MLEVAAGCILREGISESSISFSTAVLAVVASLSLAALDTSSFTFQGLGVIRQNGIVL